MNEETMNSSTPIPKGSPLQLIVPAILLCGLVWFFWRYFQYYIDPDAISYLHITQAYLEGDYANAINAFWSPMGYWLTALLVKITAWPLFASAIIVNTIPALGIVISGQLLFQQFRSSNQERWCFGLMSAFFWAYATYYQSFTDAWQFFFLIVGLLILLGRNFTRSPLQWILIGLIAALSYYGKAYSFYFFPLMILIVTAMKLRAEQRLRFRNLFMVLLVSVGVMMLCIAPWVYLIHQKYGIWTSSTAGKLNMSWWLVGTQEFRQGVTVLVPPPYKGSLFYFEDPYLLQGRIAHFYDSPKLFLKQVLRTGYNFIDWISSANRISAFYFLIWLSSILLMWRRSEIFDTVPKRILVILFLIFPLPYWLLTFNGGRYLWFTIPLVCIITLQLADATLFPKLDRRLRLLFTAIFFLTFTITPLQDMKGMLKTGAGDHEMAEQLKRSGITGGSFVSNKSYADAAQTMIRMAWFSQNAWYCHTLNHFSTAEILRDAARYKVKYYFYFYNGSGADYRFRDLNGRELPDLLHGSVNGLKVYQIGE